MKKLILMAVATLALQAQAWAAPFEGVATYKLLSGKDKSPKEMTFSIKGDKFRTDVAEKGRKGSMIMDMKSKKMIILMPDEKKYMEMSLDGKMGQGKAKNAGKLVKTGKTETIAGYKAEEWAYEGGKDKLSIWGTKDLGGWTPMNSPEGGKGPQFDIPAELKDGSFFMLRVSGDKGGMEATKVEKKSLEASLFEVPSGYAKMDMGGMMGGGAKKGQGGGMGGMSPEQHKEMMDAMKDMSPEQKAMMERMMKGK